VPANVKFLRWLDDRLEETLMMAALAMITVIMGYSVVMRYGFNDSLSWAEEVCRYLFVYSALLSAPLCLKRRSSVKIDMLILALPPVLQTLILIAGDALMFAFFGYMLNAACGVVASVFKSGQTSPALLIPMYFIFASAALGFALCLLRLSQRLFTLLYSLFKTPGAGYQGHLSAGKR
jgi:TRAP-type C4-dicarboxylate transport system permease small subunit